MNTKTYYIYIATNKYNKVLYTGVTRSLLKRMGEHRERIYKNSFTSKYNINKLIYYEVFEDIYNAISREKQIKAGSRKKKLKLINKLNPEWRDLIEDMW